MNDEEYIKALASLAADARVMKVLAEVCRRGDETCLAQLRQSDSSLDDRVEATRWLAFNETFRNVFRSATKSNKDPFDA